MKKIFSRVLSLALILSLLPSQALAAPVLDFSSVKEGEKIVVTLTLPDYENVMTAEAVVEFPGTVLELESVTSGVYPPLDFEDPNVTTATNNGKVTIAHTNETLGTCTVGGEYAKLTFSIKSGAAPGSYDIKLTELTMSASDYVTNIAASDAATLPKTISVVVPKAPISSVTASVTAPAAGAALDFTGTVASSEPYSITKVEWFEGTDATGTPVTGPATAKAQQQYYGRITLKAATDETFAASLHNSYSGDYSVYRKSDTELYLTKAYPKTGDLPATVTAAPAANLSLKYNGSEQVLLGFVGTATNGTMQYSLDNSNWDAALPKGTDAGEYTVYYKAKGNSGYSDSAVANISVTIAPKDISTASSVTIGSIADQSYTGSAITPNPAVTDGTTPLAKDTDYTVSCADIYVGSANLTITGKGNYTGTKSAPFNIVAAEQTPTFTTPVDLAKGGHRLDLRTLVQNAKGDMIFTIASGTAATLSGHELASTGTTGAVTIKVSIGAKDMNGDGKNEYNAYSKSDAITVNVVDKTTDNSTMTVTQGDITYGETVSPTTSGAPADAGAVTFTYEGRDGTTYATPSTAPTNAGKYTVKAKCESSTTIYRAEANFEILPKSISGMTVTLNKTSLEYNGSAQTVNVTGVGSLTTADYNVTGETSGTNVRSYTVTVTGKGNYTNTATATWEITQATPTYTAPTGLTAKYGQTLADIALPTGWSWMDSTQSVGDASTTSKTFKAKFTPTDNINYKTVENIDVSVTVGKADAQALADIPVSQNYTVTTGEKAIGAVMPADAGTLTYAPGTASKTGSVTVTSWAVDTTGKVTYTLSSGAAGNTVTLPVTIESTNYADSIVNVKITLTNPSYFGGGGGGSSTPSYSITVDKTENGTITVSPKSASKGDTVTITVKPDKGYELEMLKALDKDGDALKLTEKNGKYTFTMPTGKVTVKGSFVEEAPVQIFKDVPTDAYYYEAVKWAAEKGVTGGVGNGLFAPNQPCTRAQIVTFLWRAAGSPAPKNMSSFTDVPADAFYAKAVAWAVENGITGGTGDGKFSPDATCTRAQSVTFLYRAAGSPAVSGSAEFGDVATNAYYADAVAWAAKNGITGGIGGGLFGSGNDCTRGQIVTFLYRSVK